MIINKRPVSVAVIAWFLIVSSILNFIILSLMYKVPDLARGLESTGLPLTKYVLLRFQFYAVQLVLGIAILKGFNWGRIAYLCFFPLSKLFHLFYFDLGLPSTIFGLVIGAIFYVVILIFLTRPVASAFFSKKNLVEVDETKSPQNIALKKNVARKILAVIVLVLGAYGIFTAALMLPLSLLSSFKPVLISTPLIILTLGIGFVFGGAALWEWTKKWFILALIMVIDGGLSIFIAMFYFVFSYSSVFKSQGLTLDKMSSGLLVLASFGISCVVGGIFLLIRHSKKGKLISQTVI